MNQQITYDPKTDTLYIFIKAGFEARFIEVMSGVMIELDDDGQLLGIEVLNASRLLRLLMAEPLSIKTVMSERVMA